MSIYRQMLEEDLDRKVNLQYSAISTNQLQKERAQRLLKPQADIKFSQVSLFNQQVLCYVNELYLKYGIQDPILKIRKERGIVSFPINNSNIQANLSDRLTKTKKKLINLKEKFKKDRQEVVKKQNFKTSFKGESYNVPKIIIEKSNKPIGFRTKQKIKFKTVTEQIQNPYSLYVMRQQLNYSYNQTRNQSLSFSITNKKQNEKMFVKFCPYCEQNLTLASYKIHQLKCTRFKDIDLISNENINNLVMLKIGELQRRLLHQVNKKTPQRVAEQFIKFRQTLLKQIQMGKDISLQLINSDFNSFSINLCKEMNKLKWFRDFHDSLYLSHSFDPYL